VETRIDAETVRIRLRLNLERNIVLWVGIISKYRPLLPGESHSGKIVLNLPITNASPVYSFNEFGKKREQVVLHRAVLEVGYFEGDLFNTLSEMIERGKRDTTGNIHLQMEARYLPKIKYPQSRDAVYLPGLWSGIGMEKCAKVVVTDVDIPCSIAVDQ